MKRKAFLMQLNPGKKEVYKNRHDEIFPELKSFLSECGIRDYSIFWDAKTNLLFGYQLIPENFDDRLIIENHIVQKWWKFMQDIMDTNEDNSPVTRDLEEVFHMN